MTARRDLYAALMAGGPHSPQRSAKASDLIDAYAAEFGADLLRKAIATVETTPHPADISPHMLAWRRGGAWVLDLLRTMAAGQPATNTPDTQAPAVPDLHAVIADAVSSFQARAHGGGYDQQLTNHILTAVAPLVPYREVWDASLPPGGRCCGTCGQPTESEPCPDHAPKDTTA